MTDRETLLKLKAEFPQLDIPITTPNGSQHASYKGPRKTFSWGAIPTESPAASSVAPSAATPPPREEPVATLHNESADSAAPGVTEGTSGAKFQWGALPASLPSIERTASSGTASSDHEDATRGVGPDYALSARPAGVTSVGPFSWGPLPGTGALSSNACAEPSHTECGPSQQRYTWGPLPP